MLTESLIEIRTCRITMNYALLLMLLTSVAAFRPLTRALRPRSEPVRMVVY
jgi:hypothetical protein